MVQSGREKNIKNKRRLCMLTSVLIFTLIAILCMPGPSQAASKVYRWRVQHFLPATHPGYIAFKKWCDDVKVASSGRLVIKSFPIGGVVPARDQWEAVSKGVIQMGLSYGAFWVSKDPMAGFSVGIPFTMRDIQDHNVFLRSGGGELIRQAYAKQNIYFLRQIPCIETVMVSKKPVNSVDDLKGLKIRAAGLVGEMLAQAGAAVMYLPGPEIYGALEKGIVDAAVYGPLNGSYELGLHEVAKYVVLPPFAIEADEMIINMDAWKALPDDLKKLLYLSSADHSEVLAGIYRKEDQMAFDAVVKKGLNISRYSAQERLKLTQLGWKVVDKYASKSPDFSKGAALLKNYLKLTGIYTE